MVFTGIVEGTGVVSSVTESKNLTKISVKMPSKFSDDIKIGASVCIDGVCLTVSSINRDELGFDISPRTKQLGVEHPAQRQAGIMVSGVTQLVDKLKNEAKVIS